MALTLAFDIVLCNLDTIAGVSVHQTFKVTGHKLQFDESYIPSVSRTFMGDSREKVSEAIGNTMSMLQELIQSYQLNTYVTGNQTLSSEQWDIVRTIKIQVKQIIVIESKVLEGLDRLSDFKRYMDDKEFKLKINRFKTRFENIVEKIKQNLLPILDKRIMEKNIENDDNIETTSDSKSYKEKKNIPTKVDNTTKEEPKDNSIKEEPKKMVKNLSINVPPPPTGFRLSPDAPAFYSPQISQPQTILSTFKNLNLNK